MSDLRSENVIGGAWVPTRSGSVDEVVDPATGDVLFSAAASNADDVDAAVRAASDAFQTWGRTTPVERATALL